MYTDDNLIMLSALQHFLFCERQCALIHVEQQWIENRFTAEGRIMHERVHSDARESRGDIRIVFGMPLRSLELGVVGKADVVEFHLAEKKQVNVLDPVLADKNRKNKESYWQPFPVEFKRGKPKKDNTDVVQLCAQALCLEEMTGIEVPSGAMFYGKKKRRQNVTFDQKLRQETADTAIRLRELIVSGITPLPDYTKKCESCSFISVCMPETISRKGSIRKYYSKMLKL